jgi:ribose transport system substrate-binding protein
MRKVIGFGLVAAVLATGLVSAQTKKLTSVGASFGDLGNPFFVQMGRGVEAAAKKIGGASVKVSVQSGNYDINTQTTQMENFISSKVDLIVLNAVDFKGMAPAVRKAREAGIVVVAADVGVEGNPDAVITSNNVDAGRQGCQYIASRLNGKGNVVIVNGPPVSAVTDRVDGCLEVFKKYPSIKILSQDQNAGGSRDGGLRVMTDLLTANKKIDAVFAINDPTGIGAELAIKQANRTKEMFVVGVDGAPDAEKALKEQGGIFAASSSQDPYTMAYRAVEIGYQIMNGKKPAQTTILIPVKLITRTNVATYKGWTIPR